MSNTPADDTTTTPNDQSVEEQPVIAHGPRQWLTDHEPLARAEFDRLRSGFIRTVGNPVDHPTMGRNVHVREADAEAFGQFASEHDVALVELAEDARYGDLHGYPIDGRTEWIPVLVTTDESGGVIHAACRIHDSYQTLGNTTSIDTSIDTSTDTPVDHPPNGTVVTDGGTTPAESEPTNLLNENTLVGLAADDDELSWRYKSALAPDLYKRHDECGEIDDEYYTKTLEIRDWPAIPQHGFFDRIASFSMPKVDVTISTHLTGEDERDASRNLSETADSLKGKVKNLAKNKWIPDYFVEQTVEQYADVKRTQNTVSSSEYGLYTSHTYIEVRAPDRDRLDTAVKRIRSRMQDVSADARPLKYQSLLGYQTAAPACKDFIGGKTKMTGDGLSRLIPWTARNLIEPGGIELGINEDTGDPIVLDLQHRETGFNVGIWGTIGSGKTTTVTRLLTRLKMRNPEMPIVIIDPKEEFAGFTWLFDGQRVVIGSDTGINPLQIEETPPEKLADIGEKAPYRNAIRRAMDFVRSFYNYQNIPFEDKQGTWRTAIQEGYRRRGITDNPETHHRDSPTFADDVFPIMEEMVNTPEHFLRDALADVDLSQDKMRKTADSILQNDIGALEEGGEFEHLSQSTDIDLQNIDVLYLDLQNYESETTAGLMMGPLLTAVLEQAKEIDEPMALAMDEFHYMLHNSSSLETLKQGYRHSRHSDLSMITATQSVEEFFAKNESGERQLTESASTLTKLMSVKIWHYLEEMNNEWASEFDMSDAEQQYIEDASTGDPTSQALLQTQKKGSYRLDVNFSDELNPREFAMNQYDPSDHGSDPLVYLDGYTDRDGRDVTEWSWKLPADPAHSESEQTGTELADGTTITTDVADVDSPLNDTPTETEHDENSDSAKAKAEGESESESEGKSDEPDASESDDGQQSGGIAGRLKDTVSSAVKGGDEPTGTVVDSQKDEQPILQDIHSGLITVRIAGSLRDAGYETAEEIYEADNTALAEVEGIDVTKAASIRRQAANTIGRSPAVVEPPEASEKSATDEADETSTDTDSTDSTEADVEAERDDEAAAETLAEDGAEDGERGGENDSQQSTEPLSEGSDGDESANTAEQSPVSDDTSHSDQPNQPKLTEIKEVGDDRADVLREAGYESIESVALAGQSALTEVGGIGEARAETIAESARTLTNDHSDGAGDDAAEGGGK